MSPRLGSTPEHSRAQRIGNKATNFQEVPTKVARHQPVSVLRRRGFDSRRLHHLIYSKQKSEILNAGTVPAVSTKKCDRSPEFGDDLPPNSPITFGRYRQSSCIS